MDITIRKASEKLVVDQILVLTQKIAHQTVIKPPLSLLENRKIF